MLRLIDPDYYAAYLWNTGETIHCIIVIMEPLLLAKCIVCLSPFAASGVAIPCCAERLPCKLQLQSSRAGLSQDLWLPVSDYPFIPIQYLNP